MLADCLYIYIYRYLLHIYIFLTILLCPPQVGYIAGAILEEPRETPIAAVCCHLTWGSL